jgi:inorganic pyrophosphatase
MRGVQTDPRRFLGKTVRVRIDRPIGSKHESFDIHYPVNYGYVPDTVAPDGEELDAYVLGVSVPIKEFTGRCIALIHRTNDNEDKLVVTPENTKFSDEEIRALTKFPELSFESIIIREQRQ